MRGNRDFLAGEAFARAARLSLLADPLVTDIGGLNDKGFNALAFKGLQAAKRQYGVAGRVFISKGAADYVPNLSSAARQGYDLVIAVGGRSVASRAAVQQALSAVAEGDAVRLSVVRGGAIVECDLGPRPAAGRKR